MSASEIPAPATADEVLQLIRNSTNEFGYLQGEHLIRAVEKRCLTRQSAPARHDEPHGCANE